jgi:hypothetical protein
MSITSAIEPSQREILVNLGDRYAVFGSRAGLPKQIHFRPQSDTTVLPQVIDNGEATEARIVQSLRVYGMKTLPSISDTDEADVELLDDDGNHVLIDVRIRESDPKPREFEQAHHRLTEAARMGQTRELWYFNIERLKLVIMHLDRSQLRIEELVPLNVWEKTADGVFDRAQVVAEVEDWVHRVEVLYDDIRSWLSGQPGLRCEQDRTVTVSEELMQKFAVADRDIPLLDVLDAHEVIASFVPRGLWLIGSWGQIDVITRDRTPALVAVRSEGNLEWRLVSREDRKGVVFDKSVLLALLNLP